MPNPVIILSVYFDTQRTYICAVKMVNEVYDLIYIESTANPISTGSFLDGLNDLGKEEFLSIISKIDFKPDKIFTCLPDSNFVLSNIPFNVNIQGNELKELIELEVKYNFENKNIFDLNCVLSPFFDDRKYSDYINLILYEKLLEEKVAELFSKINLKPFVRINHFSVFDSFVHNYPNISMNSSVLFGIEPNRLTISLFTGKRLIFFKTIAYDNTPELLEKVNMENKDIIKNYNLENVNIFFYGGALTAVLFQSFKSVIMNYPIYRLNAFRQLTTDLDERTIDYCSRTSHIYPACIGAFLPNVTEQIRLFADENN